MGRRSNEGWDDHPLLFTSNTAWLEDTDARRSVSPEELLSGLEDLMEQGQLTHDELIHYYQSGTLPQ